MGQIRVFVPGRHFQLSLLFPGKFRSLSYRGGLESCSTWVGSSLLTNITQSSKGLAVPCTLAYLLYCSIWVGSSLTRKRQSGKGLFGSNTLVYLAHCSTRVDSILACKHYTKLEMSASDKHSSLFCVLLHMGRLQPCSQTLYWTGKA